MRRTALILLCLVPGLLVAGPSAWEGFDQYDEYTPIEDVKHFLFDFSWVQHSGANGFSWVVEEQPGDMRMYLATGSGSISQGYVQIDVGGPWGRYFATDLEIYGMWTQIYQGISVHGASGEALFSPYYDLPYISRVSFELTDPEDHIVQVRLWGIDHSAVYADNIEIRNCEICR
jgi:hypothetical protein